MKPKKPIVVNPAICRPIAEDAEGNREICFVEGCGRPAFWHAAPPPEEVVRQAEAAEAVDASEEDRKGSLVFLCSRCALYRSVLFKGRQVPLRKFIKNAEGRMRKEGKITKPFPRDGGQLSNEEDCRRVLGSIVMTSVAFLRRDEMIRKGESP